MTIGLEAFLGLSAVLFALGLYGAVSKRSAVMVLMSLELMAVAISLNMVAFSRFVTPEEMTGQFFAIFSMGDIGRRNRSRACSGGRDLQAREIHRATLV